MKVNTKSKFYKLINNKQKMLDEATFEPLPAGQENAPQGNQQPAPQPPPEPAPEPEVEPLTSEGELELIRLAIKALMIKPKSTELPTALTEPVNEKNGRQMLAELKRFMGTFTDEPDIGY